jgi:hypothetical protein
VILEEIDQRHTRPAISFEDAGGPPAIVLQLTSAPSDALGLALACAQDSSLAMGVDEIEHKSPIAQEEWVTKAESACDSCYKTLSPVPELESSEYNLSEEVPDTASQYSDTLCASIASEGSTLVDEWAPQPTFLTSARPVNFPQEDIWDEYAC